MNHVIYGFLVTFQHQAPGGGTAHMPSSYELVAQATLPVKMVVLLLLIFSIACWYIIGYKWLYLRRAFAENEAFLQIFEQTRQLNVAAEAASQRPRSPIAAMFRAGYDELLRVKAAHEGDDAPGIENVERALRRAFSRQTTVLESMVPFLATTGSTAPFIGLFGTVYGIMHAFVQLSASRDTATIDRVGPGIAEALFTTAVGLVAAIPAVIAYNYFVRRLRVITTEMDIFGNDFLNIVRRHILK
ncbi:MAG: protein TolQ [Deltaproteobacteria bacterium]|nr:protein TolQ [Myxococcales bacterium]MDP3220530.1 protein TolQ [Deltaproteobacteria bacterium]